MDPRLEMLVKDNRSSLFAFVIGAEEKKFLSHLDQVLRS